MSTTTLYRLFDNRDRLLYVGISGNPGRRFSQHAADKLWWGDVAVITTEHFDTRVAAVEAELSAIASESPAYNIVGSTLPTKLRRNITCPPMEWHGLTVSDFSFGTLWRPDNAMWMWRTEYSSWTRLAFDHSSFRAYEGIDITVIAGAMADLEADWFGDDSWSVPQFSAGRISDVISFPSSLNDWFVRMALESEQGNRVMANLTRYAIDMADDREKSWRDSASRAERRRQSKRVLTRIHSRISEMAMEKV